MISFANDDIDDRSKVNDCGCPASLAIVRAFKDGKNSDDKGIGQAFDSDAILRAVKLNENQMHSGGHFVTVYGIDGNKLQPLGYVSEYDESNDSMKISEAVEANVRYDMNGNDIFINEVTLVSGKDYVIDNWKSVVAANLANERAKNADLPIICDIDVHPFRLLEDRGFVSNIKLNHLTDRWDCPVNNLVSFNDGKCFGNMLSEYSPYDSLDQAVARSEDLQGDIEHIRPLFEEYSKLGGEIDLNNADALTKAVCDFVGTKNLNLKQAPRRIPDTSSIKQSSQVNILTF